MTFKQLAKTIGLTGMSLVLGTVLALSGCKGPQSPSDQKQSIDIAQDSIQVYQGHIFTLDVQTNPAALIENIKWKSSDDTLVSVDEDSGEINAKEITTEPVIITAYLPGNDTIQASCAVTVIAYSGGSGGGTNPDDSGNNAPVTPPEDGINISGNVNIIESSGWLDSLCVKWEKLAAASSYNVYYRGGAVTGWTRIDDPLIREYDTCYRADIPGLAAAANYEVKVLPVDDSGAEFGSPSTAASLEVKAHDRSGFAFSNGNVPGAYNADGTPKTGARILYITDENKDTVTMGITTDSKGKETVFTGLDAIVETGMQKGYEKRPLIVRFIGKVNEKQGSPFTDSEGSVMIKDNGKNNGNTSYITMEGIGDDATAYGWGFRTSRASNVEIRNLGFMLSNTTQKDAIELANSESMWVHNCDFFYMMPGTDSDQKKGDGSLDIKQCTNVTVSYNHYWDSGKTHLLGNGTETPGYLTYHHNWYDHSDSRHPRVRFHNVHVYNNYYDGVGKYGIGATMGSSIFAEANYFRDTKKPMLISMQGTDIAGGGAGTFSGEAGGIIKAYNNYMDAQSKAQYRPFSSTNLTEFDAYEVGSASETVPAAVTTKNGGNSYNNFSIPYIYNVDNPETARTNVMTWAGRYWGGDFSYTFNNATDDALTDEPMPALLAKLKSYTSKLVSVQGGNNDQGGGGTVVPPAPPPVEGSVFCSFGMTTSSGSSVYAVNDAFLLTSSNGTKASAAINGTSYDTALKLETNTIVTFTITEPMTLTLYVSAVGNIKIDDVNQKSSGSPVAVLSMALEPGAHTIKKGDSMNLWLIGLAP